MIKVGSLIIDVYDDTEATVARSLTPDQQAELKVASPDDVARLRDHEFALVMKTASDQVLRRLPVHDLEAVKTSSAYFERTQASLPPAMREIAQAKLAAAAAWLAGDEKAERAHRTVAYIDLTQVDPGKTAAPAERCWGLNLEGRDVFPLHTAEHVKVALARFTANCEGLSPASWFDYARALEKRAAALGVPVPADSRVHLYTGTEMNLATLGHAIEKRKHAAAKAGVPSAYLDQLNELAGCVLPRGDIQTDGAYLVRQAKQARLQKLSAAHVISNLLTFDKLAGFTNRDYLRWLPDPFAAVFAKTAEGCAMTVVDGVDLAKISPEALAGTFDEEFVKAFAADPVSVYHSLPTPVKARLRQLAGEQPAAATPKAPEMGAGDPMAALNPTYANGVPQSN